MGKWLDLQSHMFNKILYKVSFIILLVYSNRLYSYDNSKIAYSVLKNKATLVVINDTNTAYVKLNMYIKGFTLVLD